MTSAANMPQAGRPGSARPDPGFEAGSDPLRPVRRRLRVIRRAGRTLLAVRAASAYFSAALLLVAVLIFADYLVRFPTPARFVVLALLIAAALIGARRLGLPVSRYRPPLADIALRVERYLDSRLDRHADEERRPSTEPLRTRLAAGVGIGHDAAPDPLSGALMESEGDQMRLWSLSRAVIELSAENMRQIYIPEGFAHGFMTLANETEVLYEMTAVYNAEAARGFAWNDPGINIGWPEPRAIEISPRDAALEAFSQALQ